MLTGFKAGIGLVIVLDQVPKLLGIHITKQGFFRDAASLVHHLPTHHPSRWRSQSGPLPRCWSWSEGGRTRPRP